MRRSTVHFTAFRSNIVFFYSPSDLQQTAVNTGQLIRIGGLVETGSIVHDKDNAIQFHITDGQHTIDVVYQGMLPTLFREGQGAVVEGYMEHSSQLRATRVLTKHDENYMPKEVVEALKKNGRWQEEQ